jgi:FkbM family methyltransferase
MIKWSTLPRSLFRRLPLSLHVDGKAKDRLLRVLDAIGTPHGIQEMRVEGDTWRVDLSDPNERFFYHFCHNLLYHVRSSPLYWVIDTVFRYRGGYFVDVGANLGLYGYAARKQGASAILFEPEPTHYQFLDRNSHLFDACLPVALSDQNGEVTFYVADAQHSGASSLVMPEGGWEQSPYHEQVRVDARRFDAVADERGLPLAQLDLLKIDVEGHEASVVRGMQGYLEGHEAAPIWIEVRGPASDREGGNYEAVLDLVEPFGYVPYVVEEKLFRGPRLRPFRDPADVTQVFELLLLHPERHEEVLSALRGGTSTH